MNLTLSYFEKGSDRINGIDKMRVFILVTVHGFRVQGSGVVGLPQTRLPYGGGQV